MKRVFLALGTLAILGTANSAQAAKGLPLIIKSNAAGFAPIEWVRMEKCEVHEDAVVITRQFGISDESGFTSREERPLTLSGNLRAVMERARKAKLEQKENGMCDAPSTEVTAYPPGEKAFTVFSTGGCGSPRLERLSGDSHALRELVDAYCPTTHDHVRR